MVFIHKFFVSKKNVILGNIVTATSILTDFDRRHSNYASISLRLISIERRRLMAEEYFFFYCFLFTLYN